MPDVTTKLKPIEFDSNNPLVIRIHKDGGAWVIEPSAAHKGKMNKRGRGTRPDASDSDMPGLNEEYTARRKPSAPTLPEFKADPAHTPIVMREGESVKFVCDPQFAFTVWVDRDGNVDPVLAAPGNPFGWKLPKPVAPGTDIMATVLKKNGGVGPREQRFYKFSAWVVDEDTGQTVAIDPDGYCDR